MSNLIERRLTRLEGLAGGACAPNTGMTTAVLMGRLETVLGLPAGAIALGAAERDCSLAESAAALAGCEIGELKGWLRGRGA